MATTSTSNVTANTQPAVKRTRQARFTDGQYMVSAVDHNGDSVYKTKSVAWDIESAGNAWINDGLHTDVTFWQKFEEDGKNFFREDSSWLKGPKKAAATGKTIDRVAIEACDNLSSAFAELSKLLKSGKYVDAAGQEVYDDAMKLFKHMHLSGPAANTQGFGSATPQAHPTHNAPKQ